MRDAFCKELNKLAAENPELLLLTGDIGFQVFDQFRAQYPDRFYNMGVAEANMIGTAAGLALSGKKPFVYTIIPFLTMRAFEQIRNDVCMQNQPVKIVGVGGGVAYGVLGPTHHSIVDLAILRALPNMTVISPCDPLESQLATRAAFNHSGPVYLRLGKNGEPALHDHEYDFEIGQAVTMREGGEATIIVCGAVTRIALETSELLGQKGIGVRVINMHTLKPIDKETILKAAEETRAIVTVEEHNIIGGLGSAVAEVLAEANLQIPFRRVGINDSFGYGVGSQTYHLNKNGINTPNITKLILELIKEYRG
ncbi:Apulose-4-phosphate transketolase subunit B [subsurface metagenome]